MQLMQFYWLSIIMKKDGITARPKLNKEVINMRLKIRSFELTISSEFALIICWIIKQLSG